MSSDISGTSTDYFILYSNFSVCRIFNFLTLSAHKLFVFSLLLALNTNFKILLEGNSLDLIYAPPCSEIHYSNCIKTDR